jgi:uncharacterized protein
MTPREVFETMREQWVAGRPGIREDIWGEDLVVEVPFAAPGRHKRVEGREECGPYWPRSPRQRCR